MNYIKLLIFILIFVVSLHTYSFEIIIRDSLPNKDTITIVLKAFENGNLVVKEPVNFSNNKQYATFNIGNYKGYVELEIEKFKNSIGFIVNPQETNMKVSFRLEEFKNGKFYVENSKDNNMYALLLETKRNFDAEFQQAKYKRTKLSRFDSFYLNKQLIYEKEFQKKCNQLNTICDSILKYDTTLLTAQIADFLKIPVNEQLPLTAKYFDNYDALLHWHYFDFIKFNQSFLLTHPAFAIKIRDYLDHYVDLDFTSQKEAIDIIMQKVNFQNNIKEYAFNTILDYYLSLNMDAPIAYLNEKYANGCGLQLSAQKLKEFSGIVQTQIGATIPDIIAYDSKNELRSLLAEVAKNKLTVVYVWLSSCHACQKRTPELLSLLAPFQKKGLGVFTISLDENKDTWLSAILKYNMNNLINISELTSLQKSTILPKLNIRTTPKLFLLDKAGKILLKDGYNTELINKINSIIK